MKRIIDAFVKRLPKYPYASDTPTYGLVQFLRKREALHKRHIQLHPDGQRGIIALDVDRNNAVLDWDDRLLPPPNFVVQKIDLFNYRPAHSFAYYLLDDPVSFHKDDEAPKQFYNGVVRGLTAAWDADWNYHGFLGWNPLAERCPIYRVHYFSTHLYKLGELARHVDTSARMPNSEPASAEAEAESMKRDAILSGSQGDFEWIRLWAYRNVDRFRRHSGFSEFRIALAEEFLKVTERSDRNAQRLIHRIAEWTWAKYRQNYRRPCANPGILGLKGTGMDRTTACREGQTYTAQLRRGQTEEKILSILHSLPKGATKAQSRLALAKEGISEGSLSRYSKLINANLPENR